MRWLTLLLVAVPLVAITVPPRLPPHPAEIAEADVIAIGRVERGAEKRADFTVERILKGAPPPSLTFFCDGNEPLPSDDYLVLLRDDQGRLSLIMAWPTTYTAIVERYEQAVANMPRWRYAANGIGAVVVPDDYDGKPSELWLILRNFADQRITIPIGEWRIELREISSGTTKRLIESTKDEWQFEPGETHGHKLKDLPALPAGRYEVRAESAYVIAAPFLLEVSASPAPPPSASGSAP